MTPFKPRDRVHLKGHPHTPHTTGTVRSVDALGVHVLWDDGEVVTAQQPLYLEPAGEPMQTDSNTFKSGGDIVQVYALTPQEFVVNTFNGEGDVKGTQAVVDNTDGEAFALAVLEAAYGSKPVAPEVARAMEALEEYKQRIQIEAEDAADREKLEAEALELFNALREANDNNLVDGFHDIPTSHQGTWLAVAKTSRHLHGVTK